MCSCSLFLCSVSIAIILLLFFFFFFFQAEDGIRDTSVTGVQTCALPILVATNSCIHAWTRDRSAKPPLLKARRRFRVDRSEERRVGKECRSRWSPDH